MNKSITGVIKAGAIKLNIYDKIIFLKKEYEIKKRLKLKKKLFFDVHLVDHCNLNCICCNNFAPLADDKYYLDIESFKKDMSRIFEITDGGKKFEGLNLLGGEPLLHPGISEFITAAREIFRHARIVIVTNGVLLTKQKEEFFNTVKNNNAEIQITKYPVNLDFAQIEKILNNNGIKHGYSGNSDKPYEMFSMPFDIAGTQNINNSFRLCVTANACTHFREGKIYPCAISALSFYFNKQFNTNLSLSKDDFIDIYKVKTVDEILEFLTKPKPFCKYCNIEAIRYGIKWTVSGKDISEWT